MEMAGACARCPRRQRYSRVWGVYAGQADVDDEVLTLSVVVLKIAAVTRALLPPSMTMHGAEGASLSDSHVDAGPSRIRSFEEVVDVFAAFALLWRTLVCVQLAAASFDEGCGRLVLAASVAPAVHAPLAHRC
jgi:hypothetical protein